MYKYFDYHCTNCNYEEEKFVDDDDAKRQFCSKCGALMIKKVSAPGIVKGNFYNDKAGKKRVG